MGRLLIDETFATATYTTPVAAGWVEAPASVEVVLVPALMASGVAADDFALISSAETLWLQDSHELVGDIAVVADHVGAVAMRTPVRPDDVAATPVRLFDTSRTAETLARATVTPFYGIAATSWPRGDEGEAAEAEVVIVEGAEALREPEAGYSEDLVRAWFILTDQSFVSHVLVVPRSIQDEVFARNVAYLDALRTTGQERRREWRASFADQQGVGRDRAYSFWAAQRLALTESDRRALLDVLGRGARGSSSPTPSHIQFRDGTSRD